MYTGRQLTEVYVRHETLNFNLIRGIADFTCCLTNCNIGRHSVYN